MATVEASINAALMEKIGDFTTFLPLIYVEKGGSKPKEYIEVAHLPNQSERWALAGSDPLGRMGILLVTHCGEIGQYGAYYQEEAGLIAAHFARDEDLTSGGVTITIVKADVGVGRADGKHWRTPVSVHYTGSG